jgi:hypothetical protein
MAIKFDKFIIPRFQSSFEEVEKYVVSNFGMFLLREIAAIFDRAPARLPPANRKSDEPIFARDLRVHFAGENTGRKVVHDDEAVVQFGNGP